MVGHVSRRAGLALRQPASANLGNGLTESRSYNNRGWLGSIAVGSVYSLTIPPPPVGYAGNGNVLIANDSENGNWTYNYDTLNRLQTAVIGGQTFTYTPDAYGNMSCTAPQGMACTPLGLAFNNTPQNNQISTSGYKYDAVGNLLSDNTHGYVYDAENRLACVGVDINGNCTTNSTYYFYDPQGQRVGKQQYDTLEDYVYDPQGHIISVHDGSANLLRSELYSPDGRHVATLNGNSWSTSGLFWNHADWLGTERVRWNYNNGTASVVETCTDTPYGMNLACPPPPDTSPMHFTGKQRDYESNLDYFGARYFGGGNSLARFMTTDPSGQDAADPSDPQTWNMYAYVRNNPTTNVDPDGEDCISTSNQTTASVTVTVTPGQTCSDGQTYVYGTVNMKSFTYNGTSLGYSFTPYDTAGGTVNAGTGSLPLGQPDQALTPSQQFVLGSVYQQSNGPVNLLWGGTSLFFGTAGAASLIDSLSLPMSLNLSEGSAATGASSDYIDVTRPSSKFPNRLTNVSSQEFGDNLQAEGFTKSQEGDVTKYTKGNTQYTVYKADSTGGPSAQVKVGGKVVGTIRLQP